MNAPFQPKVRPGGIATKPRTSASQSNTKDVYELLRSDILACRRPPGTKLKIADLCDELGVSNGAVREALSRLTSDHLVTAYPQRGFAVAPMSRRDLIDLSQARVLIENECLAHAVEHRNVEWESRIVATFHRIHRLSERDPADPARLSDVWVSAHEQFHQALVATCENGWLLRLRQQLYEKSERYRRLSVPIRKKSRDVDGEHKKIMDAALAGDIPALTARMAAHLNLTTSILLGSNLLDEN